MPGKLSRRIAGGIALFTLLVAAQGCKTATPAGSSDTSQPPPAASPPATSPSAAASPSSAAPAVRPDPKLAAVLAGKRQVIVHVVPADQDLSATYEGPIALGDGTDDGARFRILPLKNGKHLMEALRAREEGGRWCISVQTENNQATLETVECQEAAETVFTIEPTGEVDEKKRSTVRIVNAKYGTLRWKKAGELLYLDQDGDEPATFSFADRGAA